MGHEPSKGQALGLDDGAAVLDVWFGEKCEAKHDDESNQQAVAANSAEASSCAEASKLRGYDMWLHL